MIDQPSGSTPELHPGPDWGEPRSRTATWYDPAATVTLGSGLSGLEFMQKLAAGQIPPPPIAQLLGMWLTKADVGLVEFQCTPDESMYNPIGMVHGGIAATILDSCMGCAVHTTLPAGVGYSTSDLQVRYLRGMSSDTGRVRAEGTVVHAGRRLATAEGRLIVEATGKLIATATTGCIVLR
jgi:uncharacterized protein (TIGR00369 family)